MIEKQMAELREALAQCFASLSCLNEYVAGPQPVSDSKQAEAAGLVGELDRCVAQAATNARIAARLCAVCNGDDSGPMVAEPYRSV